MKTICLSVLLYAVEVIPATKSDICMLNHVIDRAVFRICRCASTDDIKCVRSVVDLPCVSFYVSSNFITFNCSLLSAFHGHPCYLVLLSFSVCVLLF